MYDFKSLSPYEFEQLVHDLLQISLGVPLEIFTAGRDAGIDLRRATPSNKNDTIIQCKHFAGSGFPSLLSHLRKEAAKVSKLRPARYILATSVGLTPGNKETIVHALTPFVQGTADIFGADDLNSVLRDNPHVERQHFKLWLTSSAALARSVHSNIFTDTDSTLIHANKHSRLYVQNPSFNRARELLQRNRVCIIAGVPGIGKTMLAEMLVIAYARDGFEPIVVTGDISEGSSVFAPDKRQIFYYDDFLGQTGSSDRQHLGKNEDARLLRFIRRVHESPTKKFVLTTREYILADIALRNEHISDAAATVDQCVLDIADYTTRIRAQILYNHLYFSNLPQNACEALLENNRYLKLIRHKNYNPRLVEKIVELSERDDCSPDEFVTFAFETFEHPIRLWRHVYANLTPASIAVLLTMSSLPGESGFDEVCEAAITLMAQPVSGDAVRGAVQALENTFISLTRSKLEKYLLVSFYNPSITDFMNYKLDSSSSDVIELIQRAVFFDQLEHLWRRSKERDGSTEFRLQGLRASLRVAKTPLLEAVQRTIDSPSPHFESYRIHGQTERQFRRAPWSRENRIATAVALAEDLEIQLPIDWIASQILRCAEKWAKGEGDKSGSEAIARRGLSFSPQVTEAFRHFFMSSLEQEEDYARALSVAALRPDLIRESELDILREEFDTFAYDQKSYILHDADDADIARSIWDEVLGIAQELGISLSGHDAVEERIGELESAERGPDSYDPGRLEDDKLLRHDEDAEIADLFETLRQRG